MDPLLYAQRGFIDSLHTTVPLFIGIHATMRTAAMAFITWLAIPFGSNASAQAQSTGSTPVIVNLQKGVTVSIPSNWVRFTNESRGHLNQAVADSLGSHGLTYSPSDLSFAANLYDAQGEVVAMFNIRYYPEQTLTQSEVLSFTKQDLTDIDHALRSELYQVASAMKRPILSWGGTKRDVVNGYSTLLTEYCRPSPNGAFRVRLLRVLDASSSFTITVSYREDAGFALEAVADDILKSLRRR